jgi:hypothetical protein
VSALRRFLAWLTGAQVCPECGAWGPMPRLHGSGWHDDYCSVAIPRYPDDD